MGSEMKVLAVAAVSIAFFHTLLGPDHYLPFIMMSWARKWSTLKTTIITLICGIGHVGSSVVLGLVGVSAGMAVGKLQIFEGFRGDVAAWLFIGFGFVYLIWGLRRAYRNQPHTHGHNHSNGSDHSHEHSHHIEHVHVHDRKTRRNTTAWMLFVIFIFGPCEPLIPMLMYPAAKNSLMGLILVTSLFGVVTLVTMLSVVLLGRAGVSFVRFQNVQRYAHALGGATILACGLAIVFLGL